MKNQLRIIGGKWRGRKFSFPDQPEIRPTPDRVRETLFNWLAPIIHGAHCLDLFSGSGALGLEALSRGAAHVTMVDRSPEVIGQLEKQVQQLQIDNVTLIQGDIPHLLFHPKQSFDIVFIDPPYYKNLIQPSCEWLEKNNFLSPTAYIYLEAEASLKPLPIPLHWELYRSKKAGQVRYYLAITKSL